MNINKNKKILLFIPTFFSLLFGIILPTPSMASSICFGAGLGCGTIPVQSMIQDANIPQLATQTMQNIENRYGFNPDILRSAERKEDAPRAEISFDNANPKPGEKVSAHAVPEFFKNDSQNLYYTWYLIHTTPKDGAPGWKATNSIKDGKIEAAQIYAAGDYDPNLDGQTYQNGSDDPDKDGWPAVDSNSYDEDKSAAPMGGSDGVGGLAVGDDNIEPYSDGGDYCSTKGGHGLGDCNLLTDKSSFNQYYNMRADQSGDYCQSCQATLQNQYTATLLPGSGGVNPPNNLCCYNILYPNPITDPSDPGYNPYDPNTNYCPTSYMSAYESCFDYADLQTVNSNLINSCLNTSYNACVTDWNNLHHVDPLNASNYIAEPVSQISRCYRHNFGVNVSAQGFLGYNGSSNSFGSDSSGTDEAVDCRHKWVDASIHGDKFTSGSGKFPTEEEEYWKTDPTSPSTNGNGLPDEANVIGLGADTFTWNYQPGDRVGVVIEGTSMIPTDENSAYYKIMWGYLDVCDSSKKDLVDKDECESSDDYGYGFLATKSPSEQDTADKLTIAATFTPDNPSADPSDDNKNNISVDGTISDADQISVLSSLSGTTTDPKTLYYTWQVSESANLSNDSWPEIKDLQNSFTLTTATSGLGLTSLALTPKKQALDGTAMSDANIGKEINDAGIVYFKVTLIVSTASGITANRARTSVIIPVNKNGVRVGLFKVNAANGVASPGDEVCTTGLYKIMCPAVQYQMLAAKVTSNKYNLSNSDFSWTLDGDPYNVPTNSQNYFTGLDAETIIFPVYKGEQETHVVSVTATPKSELAPVTGARTVTVVHPAVFINSDDPNSSWPQTYSAESQDTKDAVDQIQSADSLEALTGSKPSYRVSFVPDYLLQDDTNVSIDWLLNGTSIHDTNFYETNPMGNGTASLADNDNVFSFPVDSAEGIYYSLEANIKKFWSTDEKNISTAVWGIAPQTLDASATVSINTVATNPGSQVSENNPRQILAAIGTHIPHYLMYNLRLALTILVMFFVSASFYALSQKFSLYGKK